MNRGRIAILVLVALFGAMAVPSGDAGATILIKKNLKQLAAEAELIVVGQVKATRSEWYRDTKLIYTHNTIAVSSVLKGKAGESVVVSEPGGTVGDITGVVEGAPKYAIGERVILFCKRDALGLMRTHGMIQGRFAIVRNRATREDVVMTARTMPWVTHGVFEKGDISRTGTILAEDFLDRVEELVEETAKKTERSEKR